jgi:hypothetical protein
MSQTWYVKHDGKAFGPITSAQLKQLVGAAKVKAETEVRLGDDGQWIQASKVKGLIQKTKRPLQQPTDLQAVSTNQKSSRRRNTDTARRGQQETVNPYQSPSFSEDERPAPEAVSTHGLGMTRAGLFTVYYGICAVLLAIGVGSLLGILGVSTGMGAAVILAGLLGIVGICGYLAILVGQLLCLAVPRASGGKGSIKTAVIMQALTLLLAFGGELTTEVMAASGSVDPALMAFGSGAISLLSVVLPLVGYICFLYFIKHLALYISREDLASSSSKVMRMVIITAVLLVMTPAIALTTAMADMSVGAGVIVMPALVIVGLITLVTFLITFIRYANLVGYLARAICIGVSEGRR